MTKSIYKSLFHCSKFQCEKLIPFSIHLCFTLIFLCQFSYLHAMETEFAAEPNYHGVFTRKIYDQRNVLSSQNVSQKSEQEIDEVCVQALCLKKQEELKDNLIKRMKKKVEIVTQELDNDRKRIFWDTLLGNASVLPFALMGCKCPHEFIIVSVATVLKTIASGIVSKFYDPPIVAALTKEIELIKDEIDFLFSGLEKEKMFEHEIRYVKQKRRLNSILQTEIEDALIEARNPTVVYPVVQTFLKYSLLLPTAPKRLLGNNPQEDYLALCKKFEKDPFFGGFPEKTRNELRLIIKSVTDASIADESSEVPLRIRGFFWGKPGCGKSKAAARIPELLELPYFETSIRSAEELSRENLEGVTRTRPDVNVGWLVEPLIAKHEKNPYETYSNSFLIINDFHNVLFSSQSGRAALAFLLDYLDPEKRNVKHNYFRAPINIRRMNIIITANKAIPKENNNQDELYAALPSRVHEIEFPDLPEEKQKEILRKYLKELHQHNHFASWVELTYSNDDQLIISSSLLDAQHPETIQVINLTENPLMDSSNIRSRKRSVETIVSNTADQLMQSADDIYREAEKWLASNISDENAIQLLKNAAKKGKVEAAYRLGMVYAALNQREQRKFWHQKAQENKHVAATRELGKIFEQEGNQLQAKALFEEAAKADDGESVTKLGEFHENAGENEQAEKLYKRALSLNYSLAKYPLASLYIKQKKYIEAKSLYIELLHENLIVSQVAKGLYTLGQKFEELHGISPNNTHAMECFRKAAEQGHVLSHVKIGMAPFWKSMEAFDEKTLASLHFAAEKNNSIALNILGLLYHEGYGSVSQSHSKALDYYNRAKDGCLLARFNLVYLYLSGSSEVQQNYQLANAYFSEIHKVFSEITNKEQLKNLVYTQLQNQPIGMYEVYADMVGKMHYLGWVYPQHTQRAKDWLKLAADTGYVPAKMKLNRIKNDSGCSIQ